MAGGDAFFEEGIHWLHIAGSLGPRITSIHGYRPSVSRNGPDTRAKSMMVAFRYDNDAVGSLYYSREIPSLFRGLRLSKLYGRDGIITFESNGAFVLVRGNGMPRLIVPGLPRHPRLQAMYRDFVASISEGRAPEMSLERAIEDQRLMDDHLLEPSARRPRDAHRHATTSSSSAAARAAERWPTRSPTVSARILILERGDFVPQEDENWNPEAVWKHLRYQTQERWLDDRGVEFRPYTHYNVGGNTKFWGSVLYRLRREDFRGARAHGRRVPRRGRSTTTRSRRTTTAPSGSITCTASQGTDPTEPRAATFPHAPIPHAAGMATIVEQLRAQGLHPSPLPLGIRDGCILCNTCNSFACKVHAKSEADVCCVRPALRAAERRAVDQRVRTPARHERGGRQGRRRRGRAQRRDASASRRPSFVVSCGAVNSAALLLRSASDKHPRRPRQLVGTGRAAATWRISRR